MSAGTNLPDASGPAVAQRPLPPGVLKHPAFGQPPVENGRWRGRKKNTVSLSCARRDRDYKAREESRHPASPAPGDVEFPKQIPGKFNYPKALLMQAYYCRNGDGTWHAPKLNFMMLAHGRFRSPLMALLDQLKAEGHDVEGARIELMAFRELAGNLEANVEEIIKQVYRLELHVPLQAFTAFTGKKP